LANLLSNWDERIRNCTGNAFPLKKRLTILALFVKVNLIGRSENFFGKNIEEISESD